MSIPVVGQTGSLGKEANVQWRRYQQSLSVFGDMSFKSSIDMSGIDSEAVLQRVENAIEGDEETGNGTKNDLLSWDSFIVDPKNKSDYLFQSPKHPLYTDVNFGSNVYTVYDDKLLSGNLGCDWSNGKPFDILDISNGSINIFEFRFGGLKDIMPDGSIGSIQDVFMGYLTGADNVNTNFDAWYINQEVNPKYWYSPMDASNPESVKSHQALSVILKNQSQWMTADVQKELKPYAKNSPEYFNKLVEIIIRLFDQEGEYVK